MVEKLRIKGDVGQIFNGNVINEAPQLSNEVNVNVSGDNKKIETLTHLQRRTISDLIDELCAITGDEPLAVYRVILTDFGAAKMKMMPRNEYPEVKKKINQWIVEAKRKREIIDTAPRRPHNEYRDQLAQQRSSTAIVTDIGAVSTEHDVSSSSKTSSNHQLALTHVPALESKGECAVCAAKNVFFVRTKKTIRILGILVLVLVLLCGWLLYQTSPSDTNISNEHCYFEGKPYSVGSLIKANDTVVKECVSTSAGSSAKWQIGK
nr:hypothetical protein [Herbaspirillum sp. B39]